VCLHEVGKGCGDVGVAVLPCHGAGVKDEVMRARWERATTATYLFAGTAGTPSVSSILVSHHIDLA
jgi:hypothetical protein